MYDIYGIGNALLDVQYDVPSEFLADEQVDKGLMTYVSHDRQDELIAKMTQGQHQQISSGGSVANSMIVAAQLGASAFFSCRIGADNAGDQYYHDIQHAQLACNFDAMERASGLTGRCVVFITPDADRTMCTYLGTSIELCEDQLNFEALSQSKYLYIEGYLTTSESAQKAVLAAVKVAKDKGVKIAISLSDPAIVEHFNTQFHDIIDDGVDLIFCNEKEALAFTGVDTVSDAKQALLKYTKTFAMTRGPKGSLIYDGEQFIEIEGTEEAPIDTLGAGDMYAGSFLYGVTNGMDFHQAGELANLVSSKVVTTRGPRVGRSDTDRILKTVLERV